MGVGINQVLARPGLSSSKGLGKVGYLLIHIKKSTTIKLFKQQ